MPMPRRALLAALAADLPLAAVLTLPEFLDRARTQGLLQPVDAGGGVRAPGLGWRSFRS